MGSQVFYSTKDTDLTDEQIAATKLTYIAYAKEYVKNHERTKKNSKKPQIFTTDFVNEYQKQNLTKTVLFAGCGSCRDLEYTARCGIPTYGIDISTPLLKIARRLKVDAPLEVMDILNMDFANDSFDGIFCETVLSHIKKSDLNKVLQNFHRTLRVKGIALVGFRLGDGHNYHTIEKSSGVRYNTTYSKNEAAKKIREINFKIISDKIYPHTEPNRPASVMFIIQK